MNYFQTASYRIYNKGKRINNTYKAQELLGVLNSSIHTVFESVSYGTILETSLPPSDYENEDVTLERI